MSPSSVGVPPSACSSAGVVVVGVVVVVEGTVVVASGDSFDGSTAMPASMQTLGGGSPGLSFASWRAQRFSARSWSASSTASMKSCQICAGYVPPATGWPRYSVRIDFSPFG